jgi:ferrochelatase
MSKRAVLLVNLGSPDSPSVPDVRRYLREFLMDGRVLDAPWPVRFCIVHFAILPTRPRESAHAYSTIWTDEGSPLIVTSRRLQQLLQQRLTVPVELAMRYQNPSIESAVKALAAQGVSETFLIPLFPHYAMSSYETAVVRVREVAARIAPRMRLDVMPPYYDQPAYIAALVESGGAALAEPHDHVLFSFHGIPERHLRKSDPTGRHCLASPDCCERTSPAHATCYRAQCFATVRAFTAQAGLKDGTYSVAFQSRLGKDPWMRPYTDEELTRLAAAGVRRLVVLCPAFVADCLETIEEIGLRGRDSFLRAGGASMTMVPCLNEHPRWLQALEEMVAAKWSDALRPTPPRA